MNPSPQTIERAEKLLKLMRQSPELGVWKSSSSKLFRVWAKECGYEGNLPYYALEACLVHLGLQGHIKRAGREWVLASKPVKKKPEVASNQPKKEVYVRPPRSPLSGDKPYKVRAVWYRWRE